MRRGIRGSALAFAMLVGGVVVCSCFGQEVDCRERCTSDADCTPMADDSCRESFCAGGVCDVRAAADHPLPDPLLGDCRGRACLGGQELEVGDVHDLPTESFECNTARCVDNGPLVFPAGSITLLPLPDGTPCDGGTCTGGWCSAPLVDAASDAEDAADDATDAAADAGVD